MNRSEVIAVALDDFCETDPPVAGSRGILMIDAETGDRAWLHRDWSPVALPLGEDASTTQKIRRGVPGPSESGKIRGFMHRLEIEMPGPDRIWAVRFEDPSTEVFADDDVAVVVQATAESGGERRRSYWAIDGELDAAVTDLVPAERDERDRFYLRAIVRLYRLRMDEILTSDAYRHIITQRDELTGPPGANYLDQVEGEITQLLFNIAWQDSKYPDWIQAELKQLSIEGRFTALIGRTAVWNVAEISLRHSADPAITASYPTLREFYDLYGQLSAASIASLVDPYNYRQEIRKLNALGSHALRLLAERRREPDATPAVDAPPARLWWLRQVTIERFKAALHPGPIQLMPFTVLIGRNGSGKSTFLEALQWIDIALRHDIRVASDRYYGIHNLIHMRARSLPPSFALRLRWSAQDDGDPRELCYSLRVTESARRVPEVGEETLVSTAPDRDPASLVTRENGQSDAPERLALRYTRGTFDDIDLVDEFWHRAVFLRLSPSRLAEGAPATRKSFEPLLDEEGQSLPALLNELDDDQRAALIAHLNDILTLDVEDVRVSDADMGQKLSYRLHERVSKPGGKNGERLQIPAWMLSEGTRRLTAIMALLVREPAPSLLCVEEIENGLDPWTVRAVLRHLRSASERGIQVIVTTHSPWVLDDIPMDSILQVRRVDGDVRYEHFADRAEIQEFADTVPAGTRYVNEAE